MNKVYFQRWIFGNVQDVETSIKVLDGYNKTFYSRKKIKDQNLLLEAANFAHVNELIYFVTVFREDLPYCFLDINRGFFRVSFLDEFRRKYLSYDFTDNFKEINSNRLFLSHVVFWEFEKNTDKIVKTTSYVFNPNGSLHITERDSIKMEQTDKEAQQKIDVSANWEDYPDFGKYEKLIRIERGLKL